MLRRDRAERQSV